MSLFRCAKCGCVENTALANLYDQINNKNPICSECLTGTWHGRFKKKSAIGYFKDNHGYLWSKKIIDRGNLPPYVKSLTEIKE